MVTRIVLAALAAALVSGPAAGFAQQKKEDCPQPAASPGARAAAAAAPERIEGEVTNVDRQTNTVTMKLSDGSTQQFVGDQDTIADLKVGDRIEAKKRTPDC